MTSRIAGALELGELLLDRFDVLREVGRGGYSIVYAAHDRTIDRPVALKLLVPPPAAAKEASARLRREVQLIRGLRHPNIVGVHEFLEDGPRALIVMDLIEGADLATTVATHGPLPFEQALHIGQGIADALVAAHRAGILHRDIKPGNILLDRSGHALLTDFGSARLDSQATMTATGGLVGTVAYLAPEVWSGARPDARADLYALGVSLYEALTGVLPPRPSVHQPPTPAATGFSPSGRTPGLPRWLDEVVALTTTADPRHRIGTAEQMALALGARTSPERPALPAPAEATPPAAPNAGPTILVGAVAAAGLGAGLMASAHFLWATPIVAALIWRNVRRPEDSRRPGDAAIPTWRLTGPLAEMYRAIPAGTAHALLDDILMVAEAQTTHSNPSHEAQWRQNLEPLVHSAVRAARDLAQIDDALNRMERTAVRVRQPPSTYWESATELERTRDGLSTLLLELLATLGKVRGAAAEDFDSARGTLTELVGDLNGEVTRAVAAAREVERSLATR